MTAHRTPFCMEFGLLSSHRIGSNRNGTLLQDLWARAGERAVFR